MNKLFLAALAALPVAIATPAQAVSVSNIFAYVGNSGNVFTAGPGLLEVDFEIANTTPIVVSLVSEAGDENGIAFNSVIDSFLSVNAGTSLRALTLTLGGGASFTTLGSVVPAFSTATSTLSNGNSVLTLRFDPSENFGLSLGDVGLGGSNYVIGVGNLNAGSEFSLTLQAVPEPGSWVMMIAGFGLVGAAMRRRATAAVVAA